MKYSRFLNIFAVFAAVLGLALFSAPQTFAAIPAPVSGFFGSISGDTITLSWTTPVGNDLSEFEVRYSPNELNDGNFNVAPQISGVPAPMSGQSQSAFVSGLPSQSIYYFGIRVTNITGEISQTMYTSVSSGGGCFIPSAPSGFTATISGNSTILSWTTPVGNDLSEFEVRYSPNELNDGNFNVAPQISGVPAPMSGQAQSVTVDGISITDPNYFGIKVYNICGMQSALLVTQTGSGPVNPPVNPPPGGGGGGGGGGGISYVNPLKELGIFINDNAEKTESRSVLLTLKAEGAAEMAISNYPSFDGIFWEPYKSEKKWELTEGEGRKIVYAKYQSANGFSSSNVFDEIIYEIPIPVPEPEPIPVPVPVPLPQPIPRVLGVSTRVDFNTIMVNWGDFKYGNTSDLNKDGKIDNRDVKILSEYWTNIGVDEEYVYPETPTMFSVSPNEFAITEGDEVKFVVTVFPMEGKKNYTSQIRFRYSPDIFEVKSFEYSEGWIPVIRPEYDINDGESGFFVKTAGIPEGFSSKKTFGVLTLKVKKEGVGVISFNNGSFSLDNTNRDNLSGIKIPDRASVYVYNSVSENMKALASLITFGKNANSWAFAVLFLFFLITYGVYWFFLQKEREGRELDNI